MTPAKVQNTDHQITLDFDSEFVTTLADLINDNADDWPITADEARMIRELEIGDSFIVGMIEVTKLQ